MSIVSVCILVSYVDRLYEDWLTGYGEDVPTAIAEIKKPSFSFFP